MCGKTVSIAVLTKVRRAGQLRQIFNWCLATEFGYAVGLIQGLSDTASQDDSRDIMEFLARND